MPWITVADITRDKKPLLTYTKSRLTEEGTKHTRIIEPGTLLLANSGATLGVPKISAIKAGANDGIAMILGLQNVDALYLYHYLSSRTRYFREVLAPGVGQPNLNTEIIGGIPVPVPPIREQRRIAAILSKWDQAIEAIEKLIENSQQQKYALMQKLLRPVHPSDNNWRQYRLADVAEVLISNVDKKSAPNQLPVRLCNYMDVYYNDYITADLDFMSSTATDAQIAKFGLRRGDILITKDSETPEDIAVPAMVDEDLDGVVCGYHLAIIRPKNGVDSIFLRSLFALDVTQHYFFTRANGATRFGLTTDAIKGATFSLPALSQQQNVARVIRNAEKTIRIHKSELLRLTDEKTALMQQLLTGNRRVSVDDVPAETGTG